ncbi:non-ribosomal peptide synthetase [Flavitalea antarctica]
MVSHLTQAIHLLYQAKQVGIKISLTDDQLQIKLPRNGVIDKSLLDDLKNNRQLLNDFFKEHKKPDIVNDPIVRQPRLPLEPMRLSFSQERLWFIDQMEGSVQYHLPAVLRLKGNLDKSALEKSLGKIVERHESLRTVFLEKEGVAYQSFKKPEDWKVNFIIGLAYPPESEDLKGIIGELIRKPFNLAMDYMLRADLISLGAEDHMLVVVVHHIASDGWSISILVKEVVELYSAFVEARPTTLVNPEIQYADYANWQRSYLQGEVLEKKLNYWKTKLNGVTALQLPTDYPRPPVWRAHGGSKAFSLEPELSEQLKALSQHQGTTLFMTLLSALNVLLFRYTHQQDICVGTPIANRTRKEVEELIGFFVNTLALRSELNGDTLFTELLQQVRATTLEAYNHQDVPFEKVVEVVVKERDRSRSPLFQAMLVLMNTPEIQKLALRDVDLIAEKFTQENAKFDLSFYIHETAGGLRGSVEYATDLFSEQTIVRIITHFRRLLLSIVQEPTQKIAQLAMLTNEEQNELLVGFNNTDAAYRKDQSIVGLFEEQVSKTPESVAVLFGEVTITYKELNEKANQFAHYLRGKGIGKETLVPVCIERGLDMIICILGILKSGAAYVPIDPQYPEERIHFILDDTASKIIITNSLSSLKLRKELEVIEIENHWALIKAEPTQNLQTEIAPSQLAYIIYTSGSTGKPKGVMIEHRNTYSFICWSREEFSDSPINIIYATTSICFDLSVFEIFYPLSVGKQVRMLESGLAISKYLLHDKFVLLNTVPVVVEHLLREGVNLQNVSAINMAGEPISAYVLSTLDREKIEVRNLYGPTEDTTYTTVFRLKPGMPALIGRPITNTKIYIVSPDKRLVPIGVTGEICIGGEGVARGYLNRPQLTDEKFISNPFGNNDSRLYTTGDLGRWLPGGDIEYLGRIDNQVKIRGYRIELGEIEQVLQQHEMVMQAVVLARADENNMKRLVGFIVPKTTFDKHLIHAYLKKRLPDYMIPMLWVELTALPLTSSGKIDRNALHDPKDDSAGSELAAPRTDTEKKMLAIWQNLLGKNDIGIYDNFFEIGGHSLLAIRVISAIRKELQVELLLADIFHFTTISDITKYIEIQTNRYDEEKATSEYDLLNL